jgi:hypothetical protein
MKIQLTLDIFSGRPNPTVTLDGSKAKKFLDEIPEVKKFKANSKATSPEPFNLGFRGILISRLDKKTKGLPEVIRITPDMLFSGNKSLKKESSNYEKNIFDVLKDFKDIKNKDEFKGFLQKEILRYLSERKKFMKKSITGGSSIIAQINTCTCAPKHEIAWWNDGGQKQHNNNCYNYSTNYRTDTFAQPGKASNAMYTSLSGCTVAASQKSAKSGAVADCLIDTPLANNKCPGEGHLVALVIAPNFDYHWYRKGPDGKWSHKPGGTSATLLDNAGNPISDPRTASRGPYTQFCTFMKVIHGHIKIK